jgi:hypothetical protein
MKAELNEILTEKYNHLRDLLAEYGSCIDMQEIRERS